MPLHFTFNMELEKLNKKLLRLSTLVEDKVKKAATLICTPKEDEIQLLINSDYEVDDMEVEIEEDCLKILALHQPVARDLRFIVTVIKINNEMERIGDIAVNIAMRVQTITKHAGCCLTTVDFKFKEMSDMVIQMLRTSLDALVNRDATLARTVFVMDDQVDEYRNNIYKIVKGLIVSNPTHPDCLINTYLLARHLERIGDRATNIAEEVIYLVEGSIVRGE
jgi:phosphate transport system protein